MTQAVVANIQPEFRQLPIGDYLDIHDKSADFQNIKGNVPGSG